MKKFLLGVPVCVILLCEMGYSDAPAVKRGSVAEAALDTQSSLRAMEDKENWDKSQKLGVIKPFPSYEEAQKLISAHPEAVHVGDIVNFTNRPTAVREVLDANRVTIRFEMYDKNYYFVLANYPTTNLTDDDLVTLLGWMKCTGTTTQYRTKMKVLEFLTPDEVAQYEEDLLYQQTWTRKNGETFQAKFLGIVGGKAQMLTKGAEKPEKITLGSLTVQDKQKCMRLHKEMKKAKIAPKTLSK